MSLLPQPHIALRYTLQNNTDLHFIKYLTNKIEKHNICESEWGAVLET